MLGLAWLAIACAPRAEMAAGDAAAAPEPAPPEVLDPAGTYSFATIYQGEPLEGRIVIRGESGRYAGRVTPSRGPEPVEIYTVRVDGQTLTLYGDAGNDALIVTMKFTGDSYTGTWVLGFDGGEMSGSKLEPSP